MKEVIEQLNKFSSKVLKLGISVSDDRIREFEMKYKIVLPNDFKLFTSKHNGLSIIGTELLPFDIKKANSIENVYHFEHYEVKYPQYSNFVPFSPDGAGDFYCLDTSSEMPDTCPVKFWVSNYIYTENDAPQIVNNRFIEWVQQVVIDWTLEYNDYDGSEKPLNS